VAAAAPVGKLVVDPSGAATTRTLEHPIWRLWTERQREAVRQDATPLHSDWGRSVARTNLGRTTGTLGLLLTLADRQWLRLRMATLRGGTLLKVFPDSTEAGVYTNVTLDGDRPVERYRRLIQGRSDTLWLIDIPIIVVTEVGTWP